MPQDGPKRPMVIANSVLATVLNRKRLAESPAFFWAWAGLVEDIRSLEKMG